ncbi:hypothetical protein [Salisediminibacterium halotolerans]|uniref:hypothetical protein n=1 Tax=Salisediminibacterium halotolerans TaxID=517425 RepID=UPI00115F7F33|nr:hypothetical protein [Salisediminibacterium haloalkalitolerans]
MTSLDVMLKGTDDYASSGFFPRASAEPLRAWPCRVSPVSLSRRIKPGCWVILLLRIEFIHSKGSHASTPPSPPGKQETKIRIRRPQAAEY